MSNLRLSVLYIIPEPDSDELKEDSEYGNALVIEQISDGLLRNQQGASSCMVEASVGLQVEIEARGNRILRIERKEILNEPAKDRRVGMLGLVRSLLHLSNVSNGATNSGFLRFEQPRRACHDYLD